jgi:multidrug efflux pump subunit AcrA (membrane-fusion protein)
VNHINPSFDDIMRMMSAEILVPNDQGQILPGMFARALLIIYAEENALVIPTAALKNKDNLYSVFVIQENNTVAERSVDPGYISREYSAITAGLNEQELIAVERIDQLKPQSPVDVVGIDEYR